MGGSLWEFRDRYIENSPIFFLNKVETPLLLVVGALDIPAVPQAGEMFSGVRCDPFNPTYNTMSYPI